jgi:hypothetical protein
VEGDTEEHCDTDIACAEAADKKDVLKNVLFTRWLEGQVVPSPGRRQRHWARRNGTCGMRPCVQGIRICPTRISYILLSTLITRLVYYT